MTKKDYIWQIIISSILVVIAIALIITFCVLMFAKYSYPSEENTSMASDRGVFQVYPRLFRVCFTKIGKKIGDGICHRRVKSYFSRSANISSRLVTFRALKSEVVCILTVFSDK